MNISKKLIVFSLASILLFTACTSTAESSSEAEESSSSTESSSEASSSSEAAESVEPDAPTEEDLAQYEADINGVYDGTIIPDDAVDVVMSTTMGDITIRLFPSYAPQAVENFLTHAGNGYYDGVKFHRVINEFMIQGGDPLGNGTGGESIWGGGFETEFSGILFHYYGALSMANTGQPNSNGSQFFIVDSKVADEATLEYLAAGGFPEPVLDMYREYGGTPHLDTLHPVFGYVIDGMDVVEAISEVEVDGSAMPAEDVLINSITVKE